MRLVFAAVVVMVALAVAFSTQASSLRLKDSPPDAKATGPKPLASDFFSVESLRLLERHHVAPPILKGGRLPLGYGVLVDVNDPNNVFFLDRSGKYAAQGAAAFSVIVLPNGSVVDFDQRLLSNKTIVVHRVAGAMVVIDFRDNMMTWLDVK